MENTSGFYRQNEEGSWEHAPNFVYAPNYTLEKELKDTYTYPIDGWIWLNEAPLIIISEDQTTDI